MGKTHQWGTRVKPGKHGLRLGDLNVGIYGEVPPVWTDQTRAPRGARIAPRRAAARLRDPRQSRPVGGLAPPTCTKKRFSAAGRRRSTFRGTRSKPLPDDVERAICQVCTELSQYANADVESVTHWQSQMAYGYHEIKQFLATVSFDGARHMEVFRKRALCNGGGLGLEGPRAK